MLEVRALSTGTRPVTLQVARPVASPLGTFSPIPNRPPAPAIVLAIHAAETSTNVDWAHMAATRSYLSEGLVPPDGYLAPRGWLLDVTA